jgi:hypothetical protein
VTLLPAGRASRGLVGSRQASSSSAAQRDKQQTAAAKARARVERSGINNELLELRTARYRVGLFDSRSKRVERQALILAAFSKPANDKLALNRRRALPHTCGCVESHNRIFPLASGCVHNSATSVPAA